MQYIKDITGLRAIAVVAVVLFHLDISWMPGGFAGVDVFFVISGFLMTGIIIKGLEKGRFSILKFYFARANRIIPALAFLCLVLVVLGWFFLIPIDYKTLGKHVYSSLGFFSNMTYWGESGYFDATSHEKWLLHTWSLSVEWQFYLLYPLLLVALNQFSSLKTLKRVLFAFTVLGFALSALLSHYWLNASYYLLPTRAWEMTLGGLAFLYPFNLSQRQKKLYHCIGLAVIIAAYLFISEGVAWPGYLALIPTLGAFLLLQAQQNDSIVTNNAISQALGRWSYSIYLWHWPVVVANYYFFADIKYLFITTAASVLLGYLSYRYIESIRFNNDFSTSKQYLKSKLLYFSVLVAGCAYFVFYMEGMNDNKEVANYYDKLAYPKYCHMDLANMHKADEYLNCKLGNKDQKPIALLWGDSYAGALDPFIEHIIGDHSAVSRTTSHCTPSLKLDKMLGPNPEYCKKIREINMLEVAQKQYPVVFLAGRWDHLVSEYKDDGLTSLFEALDFAAKNAEAVYLFEQPIHYKENVVKHFFKQKVLPALTRDAIRDDDKAQAVNQLIYQEYLMRQYKNVYYISRDILYGGREHKDYNDENLPYTYDVGHLNISGSLSAARHFKNSKLSEPLENIIK
ncbi:acyltransferase family protein [Gayadomonas joobiniege]|uniref:acyltransferase family protein n=1 Tax=Gayadomonas joobiniege TaxID=1234606 RepID=UPI00036EF8FE|nr:acyltransferase family protein [Gayadomonas joobiniege]